MRSAVAVNPSPVLGSITPRLFTPPLVKGKPGLCGCGCALSPETSYGFEVDWFATNVLERPLYPWQRWLVIHAGELEDGIPRFRRVLVLVARQNGKTETLIVLTLYWMFMEQLPMILGTSTQTKYAIEPWQKAYNLAMKVPDLKAEMSPKERGRIRTGSGKEDWWNQHDCHYKVVAANAEGGRSLTVNRVIADEVGKQHDYSAYGAAYHSMDEVEDAQYWGLTTPDPKGIVYLDMRKEALDCIKDNEDSADLGLFEWSAPENSDPLDPHAVAMAQPNLGRTKARTVKRVMNEARAKVRAGGAALITFKAESMCLLLKNLDPAIDAAAWLRCMQKGAIPADRIRNSAMVFDVATSMQHATLYAAAELPDGRVRIDAVKAWDGPGCADAASRELPGLIQSMKVKPRKVGYLPSGPGAAVMAALETERQGVWPPRGVTVEAIRGELTAVCMGFSQLVDAVKVVHSDDPLLNSNVEAAEKLMRGDAWVFSRKGEGDCDTLYAAAGAAHLARTIPTRNHIGIVRSDV